MKVKTITLLAGSMLAMAVGSPALAADSNGQSMQDSSSQNQSQNQSQHENAGGTFSGKIMSVRTVKFNDGKKYVLAKIKDKQGNTAVLNLGTKKNLDHQQANVKEGQQIQASGRSGRVDDKPILVVYSFKTSDQGGSTDSQNDSMGSQNDSMGSQNDSMDSQNDSTDNSY